MFDYFNGKCNISGNETVIGIDKVDVTTMGDKDRYYEYGNIKCKYAEDNGLNCENCSVVEENRIRRFERFK